MKCLKCGAVIPSKSKFCMSCGEPIPEIEISDNGTGAPMMHKKNRLIAIAIALILVAIIASLIALKGKGDKLTASDSIKDQQLPLLNAPAPSGVPQPGILQTGPVEGLPQPGILQNSPAPQPPQAQGAPADVIAYIDHLKKVEQYRQSMRLDLSPAMDMLTKAYSLKNEIDEESITETKQSIDKEYSAYVQRWQQIVAYFNSAPAPVSCQTLAGTYGEAISEYSSAMIKIQYSLSKKDINSLMEMKGSVQNIIDEKLINADRQLAAVCKNYGLTKSFSIQPDSGMDALLSTGLN